MNFYEPPVFIIFLSLDWNKLRDAIKLKIEKVER